MGITTLRGVVFAALAVGLAAPTAASATPPIWELNQGVAIAVVSDGDDVDGPTAALGTLAFPFYGTTYTGADVLTVSSNGWLSPGAHAGMATDNVPSGDDIVTATIPTIAPYFTDVNNANPGADQGQTFYNTFDDNTDGTVDRAVITWKSNSFNCPALPAYPGCKNDAQVQLFSNGDIIFGYDGLFRPKGGGDLALAGAAKGGQAFTDNPGSTDMSARGFPLTIGLSGYELFRGDPLQTELDQRNLVLKPTGATGFSIDQLGEDIAVALSGPATVVAGGLATYTATVKNNGEAAAPGVTLTTAAPNGADVASVSAGCVNAAVVTCTVGDLAPGASGTAAVTLKANLAGTLSVTTTGRPSQAGDPAPDNSATATTTVTAAPAAADTVPGTLPPKPAITAKIASQKLGAAASGIKVSVTCAAACGAVATATVDSATARRLKSGKTLGSASAGTEKAGTASFKIAIGKAVGKRLRRQRSVKVKVTFVVSTEAGETTTSKTLTIKK